jgi:hypothetical protein
MRNTLSIGVNPPEHCILNLFFRRKTFPGVVGIKQCRQIVFAVHARIFILGQFNGVDVDIKCVRSV